MKWTIVHVDRMRGGQWISETVIAERCFVAGSGVISFLNKATVEAVPATTGTAPVEPSMVPARTGVKGRRVMKPKIQQIPVRVFAAGEWSDLEKA